MTQNKKLWNLYKYYIKAKNFEKSSPSGRHFADDIFRYIFVNEKFCILIKISLKFVLYGLIDNKPALV